MLKDATLEQYALADLENVRDYVGLVDDEADPMLIRMINAASGLIEQLCKRPLRSRSATAMVRGTGASTLVLPNYPATAVTSVRVTFDGTMTWEDIDDTGMYLDDGGSAGVVVFPAYRTLPRNSFALYEVVYEHGYKVGTHDLELAELEEACWRIVQVMYQDWRNKTGRVESLSMGGVTIDVATTDIPADVKLKLNPYIRKLY